MSLWVYLEDPKAKYGSDVYERNITHNLALMADKAGIYFAIWEPEKYRNIFTKKTKAKKIIKILGTGLNELKSKPEYYKSFNASNGWGTYDHFVDFVEEYLYACKLYPDSFVRASG